MQQNFDIRIIRMQKKKCMEIEYVDGVRDTRQKLADSFLSVPQ